MTSQKIKTVPISPTKYEYLELIDEMERSNLRTKSLFEIIQIVLCELEGSKKEGSITSTISQISILLDFGEQTALKQEKTILKLLNLGQIF
ncbi:MAG: hypothetical protein FWC82_03335 [Firmicutes bacterium]|nr:hypothetical protein [Bacillota bacterium]